MQPFTSLTWIFNSSESKFNFASPSYDVFENRLNLSILRVHYQQSQTLNNILYDSRQSMYLWSKKMYNGTAWAFYSETENSICFLLMQLNVSLECFLVLIQLLCSVYWNKIWKKKSNLHFSLSPAFKQKHCKALLLPRWMLSHLL